MKEREGYDTQFMRTEICCTFNYRRKNGVYKVKKKSAFHIQSSRMTRKEKNAAQLNAMMESAQR